MVDIVVVYPFEKLAVVPADAKVDPSLDKPVAVDGEHADPSEPSLR